MSGTDTNSAPSRPFVERFVYPAMVGIVGVCAAAVVTYFVSRTDERPNPEKVELLGDIGSSVPASVIGAQSVAKRENLVGVSDPAERHRLFQTAFNANQSEWRARSAKIAGSIGTALGDRLEATWLGFSPVVLDYILLNADPNAERPDRIQRLRDAVSPGSTMTTDDWRALTDGLSSFSVASSVKRAYLSAYERLGDEVLELERGVLHEIASA